ncbi:hypothetical protein ACFX2A_003564 [Malus domestica]
MFVHGPNRECTLIRALRREYTLSQWLNQDCTLPESLVRNWLSGYLLGRSWRGSLSALVLLRKTLSGAHCILVRRKSWFTKVVYCARALVNSMTCRDKCCSPLRLEKLGSNVPHWAVEGW